MMQYTGFSWQASDGTWLHGKCWQPEAAPSAVVCLVHGLGEHGGRYSHMAHYLVSHGYALLAFDLRGHGESGGQRGHSPSYGRVMADVDDFLSEAARRFPDRKLFLYGHSLGGNLALNYALRRRPALAGVVATGPLLRLAFPAPVAQMALGRTMRRIRPSLSMRNGLERAALSRDPQVVKAYSDDPLVHDRLSARFGMDFLDAGEWAMQHAAEFPLPLLLMHGSADRLCSSPASQEFSAKVGALCTLRIWDGFYHEIHNEPEQAEVFAYLLDWLASH